MYHTHTATIDIWYSIVSPNVRYKRYKHYSKTTLQFAWRVQGLKVKGDCAV